MLRNQTIRKWELTEAEMANAIMTSEYLGLCRACGSVADCVEPDAQNSKDGKLWYDIPFAYMPFWERKADGAGQR